MPRLELTVAVKVSVVYAGEGFADAFTVVVLVSAATFSESDPVEIAKTVSPE